MKQTQERTHKRRTRRRNARTHDGMIALLLLVLLCTCSTPSLWLMMRRSVWQQPPVYAQDAPTPLPRLPTVTPWPSPAATLQAEDQTTAVAEGPSPLPTPPPQATIPPPHALLTMLPSIDGTAAVIDTYMQSLVEAQLFNGAILVAQEGEVLISKGYGMADFAQGLANTPQTRFRLASLTKPFTAASILILYDRGQLAIQDPICTYLADCPAIWQPITIRHLLAHTSGIPNYTDFADFEETEMHPTTVEALISRFKEEPLLFTPGELYSYSNSGYVLLGKIIEAASGQTYEAFVESAILNPLEMHNSGYDRNVGSIKGQAQGYAAIGEPANFIDTSTLYAAGDLYSTVEDLYDLDQALSSDQLLPAALRQEMFTPVRGTYGYGWRIAEHNERRSISHTGSMNGFANYFVRYPNEQLTVIVLSNLESATPYLIGDYLADLVFQLEDSVTN